MYYLQSLCLLCLKSSATLKNIYHTDSGIFSMLDKLEYITDLLSIDFQGTALYICEECHINLNNTYTFKQQCIRNISYVKAYSHQLNTISKKLKHLSVVLNRNSVKEPLLDQFCADNDGNCDNFKIENMHQNESNENKDMFKIEAVYVKVEDVNDDHSEYNQIEQDISLFKRNEDVVVHSEVFENQISNSDKKCEVENKLVDKITTENHAKAMPFKCTTCNKVFRLKQYLRQHTKTHTGEKPFKCHLCSKSFVQNSDLCRHIRTHTGEKPFKCHLCSKAFIQKSHLCRHIRCHTEDKLFKCNFCPKEFIQKVDLNRHVRIHTGEKPFKCHLCSKAFIQKVGLNWHTMTHTGEKPFRCHLCPKSFVRKYTLSKHVNTHHDTTIPNENMDILETEVQNNIKVEDMNEKVTLLKQVEDVSVFKREEDIDTDSELFMKQISNGDVKPEVKNKLIDKNIVRFDT